MGILDLEAGSLWETESTPLPSFCLFFDYGKEFTPTPYGSISTEAASTRLNRLKAFPKIEDLGLAGALPAMAKKSALLF